MKEKYFDQNIMEFVSNFRIETEIESQNSFIGTAEYISPEVIMGNNVSTESDLWAFGCIIYQMFVGHSPFREKTEYLIFKKILDQNIDFPEVIF